MDNREKDIRSQYDIICKLLDASRLGEALMELKTLLYGHLFRLDDLIEREKALYTSYEYMLKYRCKGISDPERPVMYRKFLQQAYELAAEGKQRILTNISEAEYYFLRRAKEEEIIDPEDTLLTLRSELEAFPDELQVSQLNDYQGGEIIMQRHEHTLYKMFQLVWISNKWSEEEADGATADYVYSTIMDQNDICLFVTAVTLATMEIMDARKVHLLLDAAVHPNVEIRQRAFVGLAMVLILHGGHIAADAELSAHLSLNGENESFCRELNTVYIHLLRAQTTEELTQQMRDEIIPDIIKKSQNLQSNIRIIFEENEDEANPDWERIGDESGLNDAVQRMANLQMEGSDVYMSTFAQLKAYPFFQSIENWFYPFTFMISDVFEKWRQLLPDEQRTLEFVLDTSMFCNNDKYSFSLTFFRMPAQGRRMTLAQIAPAMEEAQEGEEGNKGSARWQKTIEERRNDPVLISNHYVQDLYRFFHLHPRHLDFDSVFAKKISLHTNPALAEILGKSEYIIYVGNFLFHMERYEEALPIYELLIERKEADADIYLKAGFCLQKKKDYAGAVEHYKMADTLKPEHLWTLRRLATCYRLLKEYDEALVCYRKVAAIEPNNETVIFYIGSCLMEKERYDEALKHFFRLDFMNEHNLKAWRGIAWCSVLAKKYEQAERYYVKILGSGQAVPTDYLNGGHVALLMNNLPVAVTRYRSMLKNQTKEAKKGRMNFSSFRELFEQDVPLLISRGISEADLSLLLDMTYLPERDADVTAGEQ
jgi:tetratricopeptide (TPR) repeat protein